MQAWISAVLQAAEQGKPPVFCVHYASSRALAGDTPTIAVLAVRLLGFQQTRVFSLPLMAERQGISPTSVRAHQEHLERDLLEEWLCFLERMQSKYPDAYWIHWAMRDVVFGWPVLEHRCKMLVKRCLSLNEERLIDLHAKLAFEYGRHFATKPLLIHTGEMNGLHDPEMMPGQQEMEALDQGQYSVVSRSTARKAELLGHLAVRYAQGELRVGSTASQQNKRRRRFLADPGLDRELINATQAARICGVSRATWYRLLAGAKVPPPHKLGRRSLWDARELRLWINAQCPRWHLWARERQLHGFKAHVQQAITGAIAGSGHMARARPVLPEVHNDPSCTNVEPPGESHPGC